MHRCPGRCDFEPVYVAAASRDGCVVTIQMSVFPWLGEPGVFGGGQGESREIWPCLHGDVCGNELRLDLSAVAGARGGQGWLEAQEPQDTYCPGADRLLPDNFEVRPGGDQEAWQVRSRAHHQYSVP